MRRRLGLLRVCVLLLATVSLASGWPFRTRAEEVAHALAGRVYHAATGRLAGLWEPAGALVLPEGLVLLGEVHDNPAHHRLRATLIADTLRARPQWRPAIVLEHVRTDQQPALDQFSGLAQAGAGSSAELLGLLDWDRSGWPPSHVYRPLFDVILAARLPVLPGDAPRERVRAIARGGLAPLAAEERARLRLDAPLPERLAAVLEQELAESHCGALPPTAVGGMATAQRYRDAHLADAALGALASHGSVVLIAGNGHVRKDRGVPWHVRERAPATPVLSVLLAEIEEDKADPADYLPRDPDGKPAADMVIFTPRVERGDPCQSLIKNKK